MRSKAILIVFSLGCIILVCLAASVLISRGGSVPGVLILALTVMVFLAIPILGALRSVGNGGTTAFGTVLKHRTKLKIVTLFVLSPIAVGVVVFLTHSISPFLAAGLAIAVMLAASVFYFLMN